MVNEEKIHILSVDDDIDLLSLQKEILQKEEKFEVNTANSVKDAFLLLNKISFDIIISDYQMPEKDGLQFLTELREKNNEIPFILLTGKGREEIAIKALNLGANRYIKKGVDVEAMNAELIQEIKKSYEQTKSHKLNLLNKKKLIENEKNLKKAQKISKTGNYYVNIPEGTAKWSDEMYRILDHDPKQNTLTINNFMGIIHPDDIVNTTKILESTIKGEIIDTNFRIITKKGNEKYVRAISEPVFHDNGTIKAVFGTLIDITKQKKIEKLLKESEEKYRNIVETSQDMIFQCDLEGNQIFINDTWAKEHGCTVEEMWDKPFQDFMEPDALKRDMAIFNKILEGGSVKNHYTTHLTKNGETIHLIFNAQPLYNQAKQIIGSQGSATNITKNIILKKQLIEQEKKYHYLFDSTNDMICVYSMDRKILDANKKLCNTLGYSKNELLGMKIEQLIPNRTKKISNDRINKLFEGKKIGLNENYLVTKNGKKIPIEVNSNVVNNIYGEKKVIQSYIRDISERKKSEQMLYESENKYQGIVENSPNYVFIFQDNQIVFVNNAMINRLGWSKKEMMSPNFDAIEKLVSKEFVPLIKMNIKKRLSDKEVKSYEIEIYSKNNEKIPVTVFGKKILFNNKNAIQYIFVDLTEIKNSEYERTKSIKNIIRNISHDIKNPLSSITATAYILKNASGEKKEKLLETIRRSVNSAVILLNNLTEFEKEINLNLEKSDIINLIEISLTGLNISHNIKTNLSKIDLPLIKLDKEKMKRVFSNLFLNSIQSMPEGGKLDIVVKKDKKFVEIDVKDTGIGISKNNMNKLFTPFFTTKQNGTGIGLNSVKNIVESHQGFLNIESKKGKGTTVTIKLPI